MIVDELPLVVILYASRRLAGDRPATGGCELTSARPDASVTMCAWQRAYRPTVFPHTATWYVPPSLRTAGLAFAADAMPRAKAVDKSPPAKMRCMIFSPLRHAHHSPATPSQMRRILAPASTIFEAAIVRV